MQKDDILIKWVNGTDVRDLTLNMYIDSMELEDIPDFKLLVYIVRDVTDLSEDNMYVFSKGITNRKFVAFVPTYETFDDDCYEGVEKLKYEKYMASIYDTKAEFALYIYRCIQH